MSNFASLLKDFQVTSNRPTVAPTTTTTGSISTKRSRSPSSCDSFQPPQDFRKLSVVIDFFCIGAQKAGTTWLHEMLCKIPQLGLPKSKEVHFWDWHRRKGLGWYSWQFPQGKNLILGEVTPCYMALQDHHVKEMHDLFPKARIVFIARDLVDRAWSALTMELRNQARGLQAGEFDIDYDKMDARTRNRLQTESDPDHYNDEYFISRLTCRTHADRSDYAAGLSRFLSYFPKEQILVLNFNDIAKDPEKLLSQVLLHVGVNDVPLALKTFGAGDLRRRVNTAIVTNQSIRPSLRPKMERFLQPRASAFNTLLKQHWPGVTWELNEYSGSSSAAFDNGGKATA